MPCRDFEDLIIIITSDQILRNKAFNIAKNLQYDGYQRGLASMIYKYFDQETIEMYLKHIEGKSVVDERFN